jgi:hypothetical protein
VLSISLELPEFEVIKQLSFSMKLEGYRFSKKWYPCESNK